jgi:ribosomal protein S8
MKTLSINYSIIKNGLIKKFSSVIIHNSILTLSFLDVLFREGVISSYIVLPSNKVEVVLKYYKGVSVINDIKAISTSSSSIYYGIDDICCWKSFYSPLNSFLVLNTSKIIFSSNELKDYQVGGQVLCIIS